MKRAGKYFALLIVFIGSMWALPSGTRAQSGNQAGLVIRFSDEHTETSCVQFDEPTINGLDLLQKSGLDFAIDVQGLGALVCSIEDTGCPANDCWCQCKGGGDCIYWSYWHKNSEEWQYSQLGSVSSQVEPGEVQGWSWGPGAVNEAVAPPNYSIEEVCQLPAADTATPTITLTPSQTPTSIIVSVQESGTPRSTEPVATATQPPSFTPTSRPQNSPAPTATNQIVATAITQPTQTSTPFRPTEPVNTGSVQSTQPAANHTNTPLVDQTAVETEIKPINEQVIEPTAATVPATATRKRGIVAASQNTAPTNEPQEIAEMQQGLIPSKSVATSEPLLVVGSGVVPTVTGVQEPVMNDSGIMGYTFADWFPYIVFLVIAGGLTFMLIFQSVAKKNKKI